METEALVAHIATRVRGGLKKSDIKDELVAVGWSEDEIDTAYARALIAEGVPVPARSGGATFSGRSSTVDIMIGFFSFILLGIIVSALMTLFFEVIDRYFPDASVNAAFGSVISSDSVHYSMAALFIGVPLYIFATRLWFRRFREDDGRVESRLTKWVTYLVLLAASVTIVGDLIAVLYTFLQGELSVRFFLKAAVVLGIAGMVFGFYALERRKIQYRQDISRSVFQYFGWGLLGVVVVGIVLGFAAVGSPATERKRTFDARRASDLSDLSSCINRYANEFVALPNTLSDLQQSTNYVSCPQPVDPETSTPYEYRILRNFESNADGSRAEYELCANFSLRSDVGEVSEGTSYYQYGSTPGKWGVHEAGRECDTEIVVLKRNPLSR